MTGILITRILLWLVLAPVGPIVGQTPERVRDDSVSARGNRLSAETPVAESPPVLGRDTFTYVTTGRRDPFLPVPITRLPEENVPVEAQVLGIINHVDPRRSVVVIRLLPEELGEGGRLDVSGGGGGAGGTYRLRLDDRIGNIRVVAIHQHRVVVEFVGSEGVERRLLEQPGARRGSR